MPADLDLTTSDRVGTQVEQVWGPVRWGIMATGRAARDFAEDLTLLPDAQITAVGSRTMATAKSFAETYSIARAHGTYDDLVDDPEIDVVYVATPHGRHYADVLSCLNAGKAVLCEKPLATSAREAASLVERAAGLDLFLMEAMWTRCNPLVRKMVELVADGAIGAVRQVTADLGFRADVGPQHRLLDPALGGGALFDLGVYPAHFAQLFLGRPDDVAAWATYGPTGVDLSTAAVLGYAAGASAVLSCSLTAWTACTATISGDGGRIDVPTWFHKPTRFELHRNLRTETFESPHEGRGLVPEAREVMRCLRAGRTESPLVGWADTLAVAETVDRIRAAASR